MIVARAGGKHMFITGGGRSNINGRKWYCCDFFGGLEIPLLDNWIPQSINIRWNGGYRFLEPNEVQTKIVPGIIDFYRHLPNISGFPVTLYLGQNFGERIKISIHQDKLLVEYFE